MVVWPSLLREGNIGMWRPGAGARILSGTVGNETPGTSTPENGTPETGMKEERETSRTWQPGTGA